MARGDSRPHFEFEMAAAGPVAGLDEAGRGPWAGPVVAAAVILDPARIPDGIDDSKKLSAERREELLAELEAVAEIGIGIAGVAMIDRDNILQASLWAMGEALKGLRRRPALALVDGDRPPALPIPARCIVGGDALSLSIAAASIVAKVTRDRLMIGLDEECPGYGFARHKGYGTALHAEALARLGPSRHHRFSFAPVRTCADSQSHSCCRTVSAPETLTPGLSSTLSAFTTMSSSTIE
jgi:ribonuclease HII